jgi:plastocyanin domain-containing protein
MRPFLLLALAALSLGLPAAAAEPGPQKKAGKTVQVTVTDDGFVPDRIEARKGEPLTLVVTRKTERTCATEIVIKEYGINQPLPLDKPVTVAFTPTRSGQVKYVCGMDMIAGTLVIQ